MSASEILCITAEGIKKTIYDDPDSPGRTFAVRNLYQTASIEGCAGGLIVRAWSEPGSIRTGYVGGALTIGSPANIERVKAISEFSTTDIRLIMFLLGLFSLVVNFVVQRIAGSTYHDDNFEAFIPFWFCFLLISSGFLQIILPFTQSGLFGKMSSSFSLIAHCGPIILAVWRNQKVKALVQNRGNRVKFKYVQLAALLCSVLLSFSSYHLKFFSPLVIFTSVVGIFISLFERQWAIRIYSAILFINGLKLLDVPYLPHAHTATIFVSLHLMLSAIQRLNVTAHFLSVIAWFRDKSRSFVSDDRMQDLLEQISKSTGVGRVSLIELQDKGECQISFSDDNVDNLRFGTFLRQKLPPISAHVITTKRPSWHISEGSLLHKSLHKGLPSPSAYTGKTFSLIPLLGETDAVAVLALTNYEKSIGTDSVQRDNLENTIQLIEPFLAAIVEKRRAFKKMGVGEIQVKILQSLQLIETQASRGEHDNVDSILQCTCNAITEMYASSAFIGKLLKDTRKVDIRAISGFSEEISKQLIKGTILAESSNQQGPLPLAINLQEIIIVSDIANVEHVLHPVSLEMLRKNDTKSMAAIPIMLQHDFDDSEESTQPWGILWLEQRSGYVFGLKDLDVLKGIQSAIDRMALAYNGRSKLDRAQNAVSRSMPAHVAAKILAGESPEENDIGYLLMIDLKESSKISVLLSKTGWTSFVERNVIPVAEKLAKINGLILQEVIWDAFFFTLSAPSLSFEDEKTICNFVSEFEREIRHLYEAHFGNLSGYEVGTEAKMRACLVHGDVSRGFSNGPSRTWTITGNAMPIVHKLESHCKRLEGLLFTLANRDAAYMPPNYKFSNTLLPATGQEVVKIVVELKNIGCEEASNAV